MTGEQARQLLRAARKLREAQQRYFSTRHQTDLRIAKEQERAFDALLKACETTVTQGALPLNIH